MRRWLPFIAYSVVLITLGAIAYLATWGSPVSRIAAGLALIVVGAGWWTNYTDIYKGADFTPWRKFRRLTHVGMFAGFGLWYVIDGIRKMLTP